LGQFHETETFASYDKNCSDGITCAMVIVLRTGPGNNAMMPPKLILTPIDFSDISRNALDGATDMASRFDAALLLAHMVPAIPDLPEGVSIFKEGEYDSELHDVASKQLSELAATLANKNLKRAHGSRHRERRRHGTVADCRA
jgi:nucleotide-binding universal stress UspA family protein